ncbi:hypothetical protein [Streptomyces physcomitrii]|uniref:hypothetical protein n=1 Tax=Streptomyces physcomitrii TaxID=2724184 RepID=UPI0035E43A2C
MSENQAPGSGSGDGGHPASGATPETAETEYQQEVTELEAQSATAARLFDVRRIIGGLFVIYGVIVTIAGFTASDADLEKAEDININLWTGLAMLALGLFFLIWQQLRPAVPPVPATEEQLPRE